MNELITDIRSLEIETLKNLKNSKAANTLRAYQADFKDFSAFCAKNGLSSMPTEPKILSLYLTHLSANLKFSTLKRRIASISVFHKLKGHYLDTKHPIIIENLLGIKRVKGSIQKGKKPILINHLKSIINVIDQKEIHEIKKARDKTIILIGFNNRSYVKGTSIIAQRNFIFFGILIVIWIMFEFSRGWFGECAACP